MPTLAVQAGQRFTRQPGTVNSSVTGSSVLAERLRARDQRPAGQAASAQPLSGRMGTMQHVQRVPVGGLEIAFETFGDQRDPALVLIMGLGTQMLA